MSRIHEALKKAEQELVSGVARPVELDPVAPFEKTVENRPHASTAVKEEELPVEAVDTEKSDVHEWINSLPRTQWTSDPKKLLFSNPNLHNAPGMEEFRTLRSRLYQLREKKKLKVIMVSSALPGEGKTFVTSNLAYVLARQQGRRVLLIDADVRKPLLHECIGTNGTPGLNDYLAGKVNERAALQRGPFENLFFIPGGTIVENPAELIANGKLKNLLSFVAPYFDWILLDSPPVVPISDGSVIARNADGVLMVIKAETTSVPLVERAKQELKNLTLLGVVLNRGEKNTKYSSYYYSYAATAHYGSKGGR
jgi:capsular exopolysaccharide synthesis family protein